MAVTRLPDGFKLYASFSDGRTLPDDWTLVMGGVDLGYFDSEDEAVAAANNLWPLIEVSRDMLRVLKQMTEWADGMDKDRLSPPWPEMVSRAKEVIARAEGM